MKSFIFMVIKVSFLKNLNSPNILAFQSNPNDLERLQLDKELREISLSIAPIARRDFNLISVGAVRISDVTRFVLEHNPDIFHFSGHGTNKGELVFQDANGSAQPITNAALDLLFKKVGKNIQCVVLSSCYSRRQARLFSKFVPFVIGNSRLIEDQLAILFSSHFYGALSYGYSIEESFEIARTVLGASNRKYLKVPKLYKQENAADKKLFQQPNVLARFKLNNIGRPIKYGNKYEMIMWVENLPKNVLSVVYNYNHETVLDNLEELLNDGSGIESGFRLYGNIQVRITLWYKNEGVGIITSVFECLQRYYRRKRLSPGLRRAINDIRDN